MAFNIRSMLTAPSFFDKAAVQEGSRSWVFWGFVCGILGSILFSTKAIFVKLGYADAELIPDPITVLSLRVLFAVPAYIIGLVWLNRHYNAQGKAKPTRKVIIPAFFLGMLAYYGCALLDFTGLQYITAQLERLLLFTYPGFVFLLGALFFGKPVSLKAILCILLAYSGLLVIFWGGDITVGENVLLGSVLIIITAILFALFQLLAKGTIDKMGSLYFTCYGMIGATIAVLTHFLIVYGGDALANISQYSARIYFLGFMLGVFCTILPTFMVNIAIGRIGPQRVAILGMASPIATVILAIMLLGEPFGPIDALGTGLTMAGIALYSFVSRKNPAD